MSTDTLVVKFRMISARYLSLVACVGEKFGRLEEFSVSDISKSSTDLCQIARKNSLTSDWSFLSENCSEVAKVQRFWKNTFFSILYHKFL